MASKEQGIIQSGKDHPEASGGRSRKLNSLQELLLHSILTLAGLWGRSSS